MAVKIESWNDGFIQLCNIEPVNTIKFADSDKGDQRPNCEVEFTISDSGGQKLATGRIYLHEDGVPTEPIQCNVRFKALANMFGDIAICAVDIQMDKTWLSESNHDGEVIVSR